MAFVVQVAVIASPTKTWARKGSKGEFLENIKGSSPSCGKTDVVAEESLAQQAHGGLHEIRHSSGCSIAGSGGGIVEATPVAAIEFIESSYDTIGINTFT